MKYLENRGDIMVDILRTCRIENMTAPIGTPVRYMGETIGHVIKASDRYCEIAINCENAYSVIRKGQGYSFSLEVIRSD